MVSIITINYNGCKDTCELIASLKQYETYPHEIIVVDNASRENDAKYIQVAFPEITVIRSEHNLGFAGGNNLGYQYAKGEFIFFLNNDMIIKAPVLQVMIKRLEDNRWAGVSPCIAFYFDPKQLQYYGYRDLTSISLRHTTESFEPTRREQFLQPKETEVLHGGAMMVRRDVIERVGLMTEVYFLFFEEFDWSRRIREAGYRLFYEPASVVYHKEGVSIPKATPLREYYLMRSRMIYARRNSKGLRKLFACSYLLFLAIPKNSFTHLLKGRWDLVRSIWKGGLSGLYISLPVGI